MVAMQLISGMGIPRDRTSPYHALWQALIVIIISMIDKVFHQIQLFCTCVQSKFSKTMSSRLDRVVPKYTDNISQNAVCVETRHKLNTVMLSRVYVVNADANLDKYQCTNDIADALISHISKLHNIPSLQLITNGQFMLNFKEKPIQIHDEVYIQLQNLALDQRGDVKHVDFTLMSNTLSAAEIAHLILVIKDDYAVEQRNALGDQLYFFDQKIKDGNGQLDTRPLDGMQLANRMMKVRSAPKQLSFTKTQFVSNKSFSNLYGSDCRTIEKRVDFFLNNKAWYDARGIPYQLGIMLAGPPGTGKSSAIKAIANRSGRHIINIKCSNITTTSQFKNLFLADTLNVFVNASVTDTTALTIPIDKRIYVLEELDTMGNIILQRSSKSDDKKDVEEVQDELCLGDILTVLDGTLETPGRILIITSNHPERIDKALRRPGRIDVDTRFGPCSVDTTIEIYEAFFDCPFPQELRGEIPDGILSPAEVSQIFFMYVNDVPEPKTILSHLHRERSNHSGAAPSQRHTAPCPHHERPGGLPATSCPQ